MKYVDIVDDKNNFTGEKVNLDEVFKNGLWHREVSIFVMNNKDEILLQKRPNTKERKPNMWTVCSGIVESDEDVIAAAVRKLHNELVLNVTINDLELIEICIEQNKLEDEQNNNFRYIYLLKTDKKLDDFNLNPEEVANLKYVAIDELETFINSKERDVTFSNEGYIDAVIAQIKRRTK